MGGKMLHSKGKILPKITMNEIKLREQLSVALRKEMHTQYWTGKMIANALGISERTVKDWVAGKRFPNGIDLMNLMTLSPQVREFIWDSTKSENDHIDKQIIKAVFRDFLEDVIERL